MWILKSGERVVDRPRSHLHGEVAELLPAAFSQIRSEGRKFFLHSHDFGRVVGETICVGAGAFDTIVFAQRPGRRGLTRFVKNRQPAPTSTVTIILKKDDREDYYVLITAFLGAPAEPEPWDQNATANSRAFWSSHALVWGCEEIVAGTETKQCPW